MRKNARDVENAFPPVQMARSIPGRNNDISDGITIGSMVIENENAGRIFKQDREHKEGSGCDL
jgi:hypothetical protein